MVPVGAHDSIRLSDSESIANTSSRTVHDSRQMNGRKSGYMILISLGRPTDAGS